MNHDSLADMVFKLYVEKICLECGSLCRKTQEVKGLSPFQKIPANQLAAFQWISLKEHLSAKAPLLFSLFSSIVSHSDHRNKEKADSAHYPGICMATAILLEERNREMCGVQSLISTLLYNSHTDKQVCVQGTGTYTKINIKIIFSDLCTVESCWSLFELYRNTEPHG